MEPLASPPAVERPAEAKPKPGEGAIGNAVFRPANGAAQPSSSKKFPLILALSRKERG